MPILSLRGYARHRGVNLYAVQKAIATGRISALPDGRIDSDAADVEWEQNTTARPPAVPGANVAQRARKRAKDEDDDGTASEIGLSSTAYTKARAIREQYQARLAKIDYEERIGKLVPKDEVQVSAFNKFRQFRDGMLNIPNRVAAMLAAEADPARAHEILSMEIRRALNEFAEASNG